jgi:uncharacterized protein
MKTKASRWFGAILVASTFAIPLSGCSPGTPVLNAAEAGDLEKVKLLLKEGRSINERDARVKFGWTPLIAAIYQRNTNVVNYLIDSGADVNIPDSSGKTAIMWALGNDENIDIVKFLIAHGADLNAKDKMGATVLSYANSAPPKPKLLEVVRTAMAQEQTK